MTPRESPLEELRRHDVRAIVMGGSAGGIDALRVLLPLLPATLDVPVLVVLHVAADTTHAWASVFPQCRLPIREAEDKQIAEPGSVTIAPPAYHLLVDDGSRLALSIDEPVNLSRPSIDVLFESAAWAYRDHLLAVLLSGANADGAAGLAAVVRAGGLAWVQSPETALMPVMPRAGLHAAPPARAMTLAQMVEALQTWQTRERYARGS
ncbi:MAG TPA: chemotaxis protein CheB [Polyangiaceae bacterium]|jgi:two-component system chemotaxis response regulator CheB